MPTKAKPKSRPTKAGAGEPVSVEQLERDAARYEAVAREHGADLSEEGFNDALRKIGRQAPDADTPLPSKD